MTTLRFDDLKQYSDVLRSRRGDPITVRFVEPRDAEELQNYFRSLSSRSRYNRELADRGAQRGVDFGWAARSPPNFVVKAIE